VFSLKPDFDKSRLRYAAFWKREIVDRALVDIQLARPGYPQMPAKKYASWDEKWLDVDYRAERMAKRLEATDFLGDALPVAWPNLGPEIYSAWCGCEYHFTEYSGWSQPRIADWSSDAAKARLDMGHPLFKLCERFTKNLLDLGRGKFLTGLTDFHVGGDHIAALRDPQQLALDMIDNVEAVKAELARSQSEYFNVYNHFYDMITSAGSLSCSWLKSMIGEGKFYIPSNDFSCMVSRKMFDEVFLEGIAEECRFYDQSLYHLDGPGALRHLDSLLDIKELDALQWVCGAGNEGYPRWVGVYQRIQRAGKALTLEISLDELPMVFETLKPQGVYFMNIHGIMDRETADKVLARIGNWK
jgi:hypothetical protein